MVKSQEARINVYNLYMKNRYLPKNLNPANLQPY